MVSNLICSPGAFSKIVIEFLLNCHDFKVDTSQRVSNTHRREQLLDICLKWLSAHWVYNLFASFPRWWLRCTQCTALSWQAVHLAACLCMTQHSPVHRTLLSYHLPLYLIILYCTWQPSSALQSTCRCAWYLLVYLTLQVYLWLCVLPSCTCTCCMTQRLTLAQHFVLDLFLICTFHWLLHHLYLTCTPCLIDRLCTCRKWKHSYMAALASITRREHITLQTKTKKLLHVHCTCIVLI